MLEFGTSLPRLRERIEVDLGLPGMPRERVLAAVVRLVDETLIRVGNEQYRRQNGSFGATTLRARHAEVEGRTIRVDFKGKSGKVQHAEVSDRRLARTVQKLQDLPGRELFVYLDEDAGERRPVRSDDVNDYLRDVSGAEVTVKDFRTWGASALCLRALDDIDPPASPTAAKRSIAEAIREVAGALGNTPAVCRASYVHPGILDAFAAGELERTPSRQLRGLDRWESGLLRFLRARS
jgi:DNA topoisomerase-1